MIAPAVAFGIRTVRSVRTVTRGFYRQLVTSYTSFDSSSFTAYTVSEGKNSKIRGKRDRLLKKFLYINKYTYMYVYIYIYMRR